MPVDPSGRAVAEVERRARHGPVATERDPVRVHRGVVVRGDLEQVVVDRPLTRAAEVEVGVAGQVDHRDGIGARRQRHRHARGVDLEAGPHGHLAGEPLVAVRADQRQGRRRLLQRDDLPEPPVEAVRPPVQVVAPLVRGRPGPRCRRARTDRRRSGWRSGRWCRRGSRSRPGRPRGSAGRAARRGVRRRGAVTSSRWAVAPRSSRCRTGPGAAPSTSRRTGDRPEGCRTRWRTWSEPSDEIAAGSGSLDPEPAALWRPRRDSNPRPPP